MRRLALICLGLCALAAAAVTTGGAGGGDTANRYTVELDNAFGIVKGADLKIAGVRAGKITELRVDRRTKRALVDFQIDKLGFGSLRRDVFCETRPQSLIGEYFIDCLPGKDARELPAGTTIPVEQTASTVPGDLINNIMRRPERERLRIILNELGAGVGARGEHLNDAIRRASPALRETDRVLSILARQNTVLRDLVTDADTVITELAGNKKDVSRWVRETRQTAAASAERRDDIARNFQRLPRFLAELRPTMAELGRVADAQSPALRDLQASAGQIEALFDNLAPFAKASQGNFASLGEAARAGRPAVKAARPVVEQLDRFSRDVPELANNAAIITSHLDDRKFAAEKDPRSPGGQGYTGFEALLQYFFDQAMAINIYDVNGYILKINLFASECGDYQNEVTIKEKIHEDPKFLEKCHSSLGPNLPGITSPDPTEGQFKPPARRRSASKKDFKDEPARRDDGAASEPGSGKAPADTQKPQATATPGPPVDLGETLDDLLGDKVPEVLPGLGGKPGVNPLRGGGAPDSNTALLDFLFGS
jgi:virulence factor Mce-like protein